MAKEKSFFIESDLKLIDSPSQELIEKASAEARSLGLPGGEVRQPDLLYGKSIFVSTGSNINGAYFLPAELVKARNSIVNKAMDIDHNEMQVVGHIIDYNFQRQDKEGTPFDALNELKEMGDEKFNKTSFDIACLFVMHRMRFPEVAEEILSGDYKVSMETFYKDFDILVGDLVVPKEQAKKAGLIDLVGRQVRIVHNSKNVLGNDSNKILKRFIGMHFSGCGLVRKPANPRSIILEAANEKMFENGKDIPVIEVKNIEVFDKFVQENTSLELNLKEEAQQVTPMIEPGLCVSYKKYVYDKNQEEAGSNVVKEEYCNLFDAGCPVAGDANDLGCLRYPFSSEFKASIKDRFETLLRERDGFFPIVNNPPNLATPFAPGLDYNIDEIRNEIKKNNLAETIQERVSLTKSSFARLDDSLKKADEIIFNMSDKAEQSFFDDYFDEEAKVWKSGTKTSLPDSSFAYIEHGPGGKIHRYLPHHNSKGGGTSNVNLDMAHLRNAIARANQVMPHFGKISKESLVAKCSSHLSHHKSALKGNKK